MVHAHHTSLTAFCFLLQKDPWDLLTFSVYPAYLLMVHTAADDVFVHKGKKMGLQAPLGCPTTATVR